MKKVISLILALAIVFGITPNVFATDGNPTITFDDMSKRTSFSNNQQIWEENGIIITNDKAISTTNMGNYYNPVRFYKGQSLTIAYTQNIEKIIFTCGTYKENDYVTPLKNSITGATVEVDGLFVTVTPATLAPSFVIEQLSGQVRIMSIEIVPSEGNIGDSGAPGVPSDPKLIVDAAFALEKGESLPYEATLTGKITEINTPYSADYKNITVTIEVEGSDGMKSIICYRMKGDNLDKITVGDMITVIGRLHNYEGVVEFDTGCELEKHISGSVIIQTDAKAILDVAYALADGECLPYHVSLTGKVIKIDTPYVSEWENISVTIEISGEEDRPIYCHRMVGDDIDKIVVGDTLTVTGGLKNYKGTIEFDAGCTLDERISCGLVVPSDPKQIADAAFALEPGAALPYTATLSGKVIEINTPYDSAYKNITVTIEVEGTTETRALVCYRMKGDGIDKLVVGDTITVNGTIKHYAFTSGDSRIEFDAGCTYVKGEDGNPTPDTVIPEPDSMAIVGDGLPGIQAWNPADLNGDMTKISDYVYEITLPVEAGAEMVFKFAGNGMWDDNYILGGTAGLIGEKVCLVAGSGAQDITYLPDTDGDMTFTLDLTPYLTGTGDATLLITASWECDGHQYANGVCMYCGRSELGGITVFFQNTDGWDVPYIYTWADQSDYIALYNGHWPGEPMKKVSGTEDIYYMPLVKNVEELVFSNAGNSPTADLTVPGDDLVLFDCETQSWLAYKPPCTHPKHDTSGNCTACGEVVEHSYVDGFCTVCGSEKILIPPTITLQYITLLLEDEIKLNVNFSVDQNIALDKMGLLTWVAKPDVVDISTADGVIAGVTHDATQGIYGVTTMGIPAQNLGDMIYFCVYAEMEDGTFVYGKQAQYSPTTYAYNKLNGNADAQTKALYVAILNYGAAAQTFLGDTDSLINANLTAEQRSLAEVYRTDMVHTVDKVNAVKQGNLIGNGGFTKLQPTIALGEAFSINYYFTPVYNVIGNMTFYYWNAEDFAAVDVLSIENATGSVVMANENGVYGGAAIDGISAKNINSALYACGVYTDANGNTYSTGILPYSLGFYCGNQVNAGGETADLAAAIAVYGYYAAAYFA